MAEAQQHIEDVVVFQLGRQRYSLKIAQVVEMLRMVGVTQIPNMPAGMLGLINYRGQVMPLVDLRQVFEVPNKKIRLNSSILIARSEKAALGLVVDAVEGVKSIAITSSDGAEEAGQPAVKGNLEYIAAVVKLDDEMVLIVNLETLQEKFHSNIQFT